MKSLFSFYEYQIIISFLKVSNENVTCLILCPGIFLSETLSLSTRA